MDRIAKMGFKMKRKNFSKRSMTKVKKNIQQKTTEESRKKEDKESIFKQFKQFEKGKNFQLVNQVN